MVKWEMVDMSQVTLEDVTTFISNFTAVSKSKISAETRLYHDLGVEGDDAYELLVAFGEEYDIDMSAFNIELYFPAEPGFINPFGLLKRVVSGTERLQTKFVPITIHDLLIAAINKKWSYAG